MRHATAGSDLQRVSEELVRRAIGAENVRVGPLTGTAADFSYFQQKVPGLFVFLGVTPRDQDWTKVPVAKPK